MARTRLNLIFPRLSSLESSFAPVAPLSFDMSTLGKTSSPSYLLRFFSEKYY
jgi:hypothetical protein